jgi:hypothetical protein
MGIGNAFKTALRAFGFVDNVGVPAPTPRVRYPHPTRPVRPNPLPPVNPPNPYPNYPTELGGGRWLRADGTIIRLPNGASPIPGVDF